MPLTLLALQLLPILTGGAIVVGLVLLAGILAGQFRRGVVDELRATLATAKTEIEIERTRSDRLEREANTLRTEVAGLRAEVKTLRSVLTDEHKVAKTVAEALRLEDERRAQAIIDAIKDTVAMAVVRIIEANEAAMKKDGTK